MGIGPKPPEVVLVKVVERSKMKVVFAGQDAKDGSPVRLILEGDTSYFKHTDDYKVTFDPLSKED